MPESTDAPTTIPGYVPYKAELRRMIAEWTMVQAEMLRQQVREGSRKRFRSLYL